MLGIADKIMRRTRAKGRGRWVCTAKDFFDLGSHAAVGQALSRLAKNGDLRRVGHGFYDLPRWSRILKRWAAVDPDLVVDALARRDNIRIMRDGSFWANRLGLTNAVPARMLYTTDGATRTVKINDWIFHFRHANPKVMEWAGRDAAPIVQALLWLGPSAVSDRKVVASLASLKSKLPAAVKKDLARSSAYHSNRGTACVRSNTRRRAGYLFWCPPWTAPIVCDLAGERGGA